MTLVNLNAIDKNEFLDLVDPKDIVIGQASRRDLFRSGVNNYRVVNVFVFNNKNEVLVPKRSSNRSIFPNCYDFSCGEHVMAGESYLEAAIRGLKEELNLKIPEEKLVLLGKLTPAQVSSFMCVYKIEGIDKIPNYIENEISSATFIPIEDMKNFSRNHPEQFKEDIPKVLSILF